MVARHAVETAKAVVATARRAVSELGAGVSGETPQPTQAAATAGKKAAPAKKATAKKAAPVKKAAATPAKKAAATPAKKAAATPAKKAAATPAKKAVPVKKAAATPAKKAAARSLAVRVGESPWTAAELAETRQELQEQIASFLDELNQSEVDLSGLLRDSRDGAGDDEADIGSKAYEREQEIALADNARELLAQAEHALARIDDGSYGVCESCGEPIGKLRLQAAPRATLCLACKTRQERR